MPSAPARTASSPPCSDRLAEVAGLQSLEGIAQRPEAIALDAGHSVVLLEAALDDEKGRREDRPAVVLEGVGVDDDVGDPRLVLEREEDEALGGARALADDAESAGAYPAAIADVDELGSGPHPQRAELVALERH